MRILPPFEEKIRAQISDELAGTATISVMGIKEQLEKHFGRGFDYTYIRKLVRKVRNEIGYEIDTAKIEPRFAASRENYRLVRERLAKIVFWRPDPENPAERKPSNKDVIEAAKSMVMMDMAILQAEMAAGIYKKPIDELAKTFHYDPKAKLCATELRTLKHLVVGRVKHGHARPGTTRASSMVGTDTTAAWVEQPLGSIPRCAELRSNQSFMSTELHHPRRRMANQRQEDSHSP
jgi:hypothetical protein